MTAVLYDHAVAAFSRGQIDWENDKLKVMLVGGDYIPSQTGDAWRSDVKGEVAAGGLVLPAREVVRGEGPGDVRLTGGAVEWRGFTGSFRWAVLYQDNGQASEDRLISYSDMGAQQATNARVRVEYDPEQGVAEFMVVAGVG